MAGPADTHLDAPAIPRSADVRPAGRVCSGKSLDGCFIRGRDVARLSNADGWFVQSAWAEYPEWWTDADRYLARGPQRKHM